MTPQVRTIKWRQGATARIDAGECYQALEGIREKNNGDLTTELVVEAARPRGSVLHQQVFDRVQKLAAEAYYKTRARETLRALVVVYVDEQDQAKKSIPVNVYSTVGELDTETGRIAKVYSSTEEGMQEPARREYILAEALRELALFRKKYAALSELEVVFASIDQVAV